ncbi:MAG: hypothetical protein AAFX78_17880 [Cyanobacteria bacterium J06638_20]
MTQPFHLPSVKFALVGLLGVFGVGAIASLPLVPSTAIAHQVEVSGDVGGTLHIEPNDTPRAGETNLTWFALTRRGGRLIPLASCNCQVSVYSQPHRSGNSPVSRPSLFAVSAEGYEGIPGANITFPQAGRYEVVLQGRPVVSGDFAPFELRFSITVAR